MSAAVGLGTVVVTGVGENEEDEAAFCAATNGMTSARAANIDTAISIRTVH